MSTNKLPVVAGVEIPMSPHGLFNLNVIHRASGGLKKHQPSDWLSLESTQRHIDYLVAKNGAQAVVVVSGGSAQGTFVHENLVHRYAMWISAEFCDQVIEAFKALVRGDIKKALSEAEKAQIAFCRDLLKDPKGNRIDVDDVKYQIAYLEGDEAGMARIERKHEAEKVRLETTLCGQVETKMPKGPGFEVTISVPDAIPGTPEEVLAEIKSVAKKRKYKVDVMEQSGRTFLIETW